MDSKSAEREFLKDFIELYKSCPCLWKRKSPDYQNTRLKNQCYEELLKLVQTIEPNADRATVTRRIQTLRAMFRKELNKINASKKFVTSPDQVYRPKLWYFDSLMFISEQETDGDGETTEEDEEEEFCGDGTATKELKVSFNPPPLKRKCSTPSNSGHKCDILSKGHETSESVYAHFGKYVAKSLEGIESKSPETCSIVRKLICDAIFEGEAGTLRHISRIVTPPDGHFITKIPAQVQAESMANLPQVNGPVTAPKKAIPSKATPIPVIEKAQSPSQSFVDT